MELFTQENQTVSAVALERSYGLTQQEKQGIRVWTRVLKPHNRINGALVKHVFLLV